MQFSCPACTRWREMGLLCSLLTAFWAEQMYWASSVRKAQWKRRSVELSKRTSWTWASLDQLYFTLVPLSARQLRRTCCPWHVTKGEPSNQTWGLLTASEIQTSIKKLLKNVFYFNLLISDELIQIFQAFPCFLVFIGTGTDTEMNDLRGIDQSRYQRSIWFIFKWSGFLFHFWKALMYISK